MSKIQLVLFIIRSIPDVVVMLRDVWDFYGDMREARQMVKKVCEVDHCEK